MMIPFFKKKTTEMPDKGEKEIVRNSSIPEELESRLAGVKEGKGFDLYPTDTESLLKYYWSLSEEDRQIFEERMSRLIYEGLRVIYESMLRGDDLPNSRRKLLFLQRLIDPDHGHLRDIVFSGDPVYERIALKEGYLIYPRGVIILNPEKAESCKHAISVVYALGEEYPNINDFREKHRFIYLTDKSWIHENEEREYINSLCAGFWPQFREIVERDYKADEEKLGTPGETARARRSSLVSYLSVFEHGKCRSDFQHDDKLMYKEYAGIEVKSGDRHYKPEDEFPEGVALFR